MIRAIKKAKEGVLQGQSPFAAVIVRGGKVLAAAHNTVLKDNDSTAHAEINAIKAASKKIKNWNLSGCTIFSTCEPCPMCFAACHWARISKIFYGASIADAIKAGFNELTISAEIMKEKGHSKLEIIPGFMLKENLELFEFWKKRISKKTY